MTVTVETLLRDLSESRALSVELIAGAGGLGRFITVSQPQKTGLALSGFDAFLHGGRVLLFGESEVRYLESLTADVRATTLRRVLAHDLPCLLVTGGFAPPHEMTAEADAASVPLLRTPATTPDAMTRLSAILDSYLGARGVVHGVL